METQEPILTLNLIFEWRIKKTEDTCVVFMKLEQMFDEVEWSKLLGI